MAAGEKQHATLLKKGALQDLLNESKNTITSQENSPLTKDNKELNSDSEKIPGTKRPQPENSTPHTLVYVRRKVENEHGKKNTRSNVESVESLGLSKVEEGGIKEQNVQKNQSGEHKSPSCPNHPLGKPTKVDEDGVKEQNVRKNPSDEPTLPSCPDHPLEKPNTGLAASEPNKSTSTTGNPPLADSQRPSNQDWEERFSRLQKFLKSRDQSSQEDYIRMLRSLSAVGRSRHAVELEKRAIHLLLEEGKELHRMEVLNVLGKVSPKDYSPVFTQNASALQSYSRSEKKRTSHYPSQ
uniref:Uncharacterized protein n=1 Tax=Ananas comosus var. bracteatus TaxID=296719 RepID=A0A6V7PII9_ANACO|nr:unnamed protein product [Ananas comosus var. bracteatus]